MMIDLVSVSSDDEMEQSSEGEQPEEPQDGGTEEYHEPNEPDCPMLEDIVKVSPNAQRVVNDEGDVVVHGTMLAVGINGYFIGRVAEKTYRSVEDFEFIVQNGDHRIKCFWPFDRGSTTILRRRGVPREGEPEVHRK